MQKIIILIFVFTFLFSYQNGLIAQTNFFVYSKYWVQFTDKNISPFSISQPEIFLSEKAIQRRTKQNISIDSSDLPVNPFYVDSLIAVGAKIIHQSKWLNAVTIEADSTLINKILQFSFVKNALPVFGTKILKQNNTSQIQAIVRTNNDEDFNTRYGKSFNQLRMLQGQFLHQLNFTGKGITIGVFDSGFNGVDAASGFSSLFQENKIVSTWDFVNQNELVFDHDNHGTFVLSTMAAFLENEMIGAAPDASYILFRTENVGSEFSIEEDNWVAAAEKADSMGVDIINSSLGYTNFDDDSMNYVYANMNGKTTRISQAAQWAARKGIIVVTSAGNEGDKVWRFISAPADADSILSVGAVDSLGKVTAFSSRGPSFDGRIKPDVAALGKKTTLLSPNNSVLQGDGTSFSSPIIAGMTASLWQALPDKNAIEIIEIIKQSSHQYTSPDNDLGYGIPDFRNAFLKNSNIAFNQPKIFPNPFQQEIYIDLLSELDDELLVEIFEYSGKQIFSQIFPLQKDSFAEIAIHDLAERGSGIYFIQIKSNTIRQTKRIIKY